MTGRTMRRLSKLAAITAFLVAMAMPMLDGHAQATGSDAEPAEAEPLSVNIELVVDTLPESKQKKTTAELERQLAGLTEELGLVLVERDAAMLFVRIELNQPDKNAEVFLVDTVAVYRDEVLPREDARACMQCTPAEMVEDGLKILPSALTQIEQRRAAAAAAAAQAEAVAEVVDAAPPPPPPAVSAPKLGAAGYVGISSNALGVGTTIAGSILLARGKVDPTGTNIEYINYRPPGWTLVGVGLGMMVVGSVLVAVDLTVLEQRRRSTAQIRLDSVSMATMQGLGILVSGRF